MRVAEKEAHRNIIRAAEKETSRNVFQRLGGDSEPNGLSKVFRNYEEMEDKDTKIPRLMDVRPPQPCYNGSDVRINGRTMNLVLPVTKKDLARLRQKWKTC